MTRIVLALELKGRIGIWEVVALTMHDLRKTTLRSVSHMEVMLDLSKAPFSQRRNHVGPSKTSISPPPYQDDNPTRHLEEGLHAKDR